MSSGAAPLPPEGSIAIIFISRRTGKDGEDYAAAAAEMEEAVRAAPGYLGHDSVSDAQGHGITISYWADGHSAAAWRADPRHAEVREEGRARWYGSYRLIAARIERAAQWEA